MTETSTEYLLCTRHCSRYFTCINSFNNKWLRNSNWNSKLMTQCDIFSMKPSYLSKSHHCSGDLLPTMGGTMAHLVLIPPTPNQSTFCFLVSLYLCLLFLPCHINWTENTKSRIQGILITTTTIFTTIANIYWKLVMNQVLSFILHIYYPLNSYNNFNRWV